MTDNNTKKILVFVISFALGGALFLSSSLLLWSHNAQVFQEMMILRSDYKMVAGKIASLEEVSQEIQELKSLIKTPVVLPFLGLKASPLSPEKAKELKLADTSLGVFLSPGNPASVLVGGPAYNAGVRVGDIVLSFDRKPITSQQDIERILMEHKAGEKVEMEVWRGNQKTVFTVTLEAKTPYQ